MLGTTANVGAILLGSLIGGTIKKALPEKIHDCLFLAMGLAALFIGINSVVHTMPKTDYPVLFIVSLALGSSFGTYCNIDDNFHKFAAKCGKGHLGKGLSTAILIFCIGTLSILGPIESALNGNNTFLYTNATLDFITSIVLASAYGYGIMLAAAVLFLWQGSLYVGAISLSGFLQGALLNELSLVGGILIAASGLSILQIKDCKTLNLLPSLLVPVLFFLVKNNFF